MITISSPSMVVTDERAQQQFNMDVNEPVKAAVSMRKIVDRVLTVAEGFRGGRIRNLILAAHGSPGRFQLGSGLSVDTMAPFGDLNGKVSKIWFCGCLVARIAGAHTSAHGDGAALTGYGINSGDGHAFVSAFARLTGAYVVAPTEMQSGRRQRSAGESYPPGQIDSYEGLVLCYNPRGRISWQHRYPSLYGHNVADRTAILPNDE